MQALHVYSNQISDFFKKLDLSSCQRHYPTNLYKPPWLVTTRAAPTTLAVSVLMKGNVNVIL